SDIQSQRLRINAADRGFPSDRNEHVVSVDRLRLSAGVVFAPYDVTVTCSARELRSGTQVEPLLPEYSRCFLDHVIIVARQNGWRELDDGDFGAEPSPYR